jgi:hypothetical protein
MTDAPLGNLDFDDMLRYVESGHNNTTTLAKSTSVTTSKFHISPRKPENHLPNPSIVHDQSSVKSMEGASRMQQQQSTKAQKRHGVKKGRASYESDDDAQIAMRLARLRREVLEQQEEVEEEVVNEHEQTDDALERLRSFRESLGIPEPQQRPNSSTTATPKATKMISKRRYSSSSDKSLGGRKDFESPAEVSEAQLLYRLQKLRQSLTSPERSKAASSKSQRATKKKRIQYLPSHAAATNAAELFSTSENPQVVQDAAGMLHPGLAKEIQQHWSMDLNNVMHMGFSMEGGPVDQFVGHGMHQYAQ